MREAALGPLESTLRPLPSAPCSGIPCSWEKSASITFCLLICKHCELSVGLPFVGLQVEPRAQPGLPGAPPPARSFFNSGGTDPASTRLVSPASTI